VRDALDTNVFGAWQVTQALLPLLRRGRHGRIVNVSSGAGALTDMGGGLPAYKLSKVSLNALTRMWAAELAADRILVNAVCPGWVASDMGGPGGRPCRTAQPASCGWRPCPTTALAAASSATVAPFPGETTRCATDDTNDRTEPAMSTDTPDPKVAAIAAFFEAYAARDSDGIAAVLDADIEWTIPGHHPLAGTKRGVQEVLAFFDALAAAGFRAETFFLESSEEYVVDIHRGYSTQGDGVVDTTWALVWHFTADGTVDRVLNLSGDQHQMDAFVWANYPLRPLPDRLVPRA